MRIKSMIAYLDSCKCQIVGIFLGISAGFTWSLILEIAPEDADNKFIIRLEPTEQTVSKREVTGSTFNSPCNLMSNKPSPPLIRDLVTKRWGPSLRPRIRHTHIVIATAHKLSFRMSALSFTTRGSWYSICIDDGWLRGKNCIEACRLEPDNRLL